jgi:two-component system, oxyanion-binding sensor
MIPATNGTIELGPNRFFDGGIFDPQALDAYIAAQRLR